MILVDSNAMIVFVIGLIDPSLLGKHKRASIYDEMDFNKLREILGDFSKVVTLPNVWTEVDNLLNDFTGSYKYPYINLIKSLTTVSTERYIESKRISDNPNFISLGLTDTLVLELSKECDLLVTSDSRLSDFALANSIRVYDMVKTKNELLK